MYFKQILLSLGGLCVLATGQADDLSLAFSMVNQARQTKGLQPLTWNPDLAAYAQYWANQMGAGLQPFSHAPPQLRPEQGENIYTHQSGQCDTAFDTPVQTGMYTWLAQESLYDGQPVTTGHEPWMHFCKLRR